MARGNVKQELNETLGQESLTYVFADGQRVEFDYHSLSEQAKSWLGMHGLIQRTRDSIAGDQKKGASVEELIKTMTSVYAPLTGSEPEWSSRGESDGVGQQTLAVEALARMLAVRHGTAPDLAGAKQKWELLAKQQRLDVVKNPEFAAVIAQIRAEKAAARAQQAQSDGASQDGMFGLLG